MRDILAKIVDVAAELTADVIVVIEDGDKNKLDSVSAQVERYLSTIRDNEDLETFLHRRDEVGKMTLLIGVSDHEAKDAIVDALKSKIREIARRLGL